MKRSRILLITALVALLAGGWYVAKRGGETTLIGRLLDVANKGGIKSLDGAKLQGNATQSGNPLEEVAGLAIKGINLFQGNKGLELWRLKASWAHMSQNGDTIDVDKPVVRYALGEGSASNPDDDVLDVQAQLGRITDNQRFTKAEMTFPEGAALESPTASGTAAFFTWDLATNEMHGSGGVLVVLKPRPDDPNANAAPSPREPQANPQQESPQPARK